MRKLVLVVGCVMVAAMPVMAQEYPRAEIFGAYSLFSSGDGGRVTFHGFQASVAGNLSPTWGILGDFGIQFKSLSDPISGITVDFTVLEYLFGPQFYVRGEQAKAFVHALLGGLTVRGSALGVSASESGFALGFGGGVDVNAGQRFAIRAVQFDWVPSHLAGSWSTGDIRLGFGVVIKLGGS